MWDYQSAAEESGPGYTVELFRVGEMAPIASLPLWKKGFADLVTFCDDPADPTCAHRNYEYRVVATNAIDGSVLEYAPAVSGAYR